MSRPVALLVALLALGACSSHRDQPGAVSADEARQLNDAAAMLDANSMAPVNTADANTADPDTNESDTQ